MPSINVPSLQVAQANIGGESGPDPSWMGTDDVAPPNGETSPQVIVLAVVCSAIGTALLAFALAKLWQQHRGGSPGPVDRSEFVPPPPPYSLDPPPPFPSPAVPPVVVANHVQATTHHGAYHDEVSERYEEEIELLDLPRRRERERREGEGQLRDSPAYYPGLADCPNL